MAKNFEKKNFEDKIQSSTIKSEELKPQEVEVDAKYAQEVMEYFRNIKKESYGRESDTEQYADDMQKELLQLAYNKKLEKLQPKDVGIALCDLAGNTAIKNPDISSNVTGDPEIDTENEKQYLSNKKFFMQSCAKIFPYTKINSIESDLHTSVKHLKNLGLEMPEISAIETINFLKEDPKKLAKYLDETIYLASDQMKKNAWEAHNAEKPETKKFLRLADKVEEAYKLQLMRDKLQK